MDNLDQGDNIIQPEGEVQGSVEIPHVEIPGQAMVDFEKRYAKVICIRRTILYCFVFVREPAHVVVDGNAGALRQQRQDPSL